MAKKETNAQKRTRLINEAGEMEEELSYLEECLASTIADIMQLNPTKKELSDGLQDLIDCYGYTY